MYQNGHVMKETITIESGEHAQSSTITVTVENESTNAIDEPANIEVEVKSNSYQLKMTQVKWFKKEFLNQQRPRLLKSSLHRPIASYRD